MKKNIFTTTLIIVLFFTINSCKNKNSEIQNKTVFYGEIIEEGIFQCFEDSLIQDNGKPYTCEPSTVTFYNNLIFLANDKVFPHGNSSFFTFFLKDTSELIDYKNYKDSLFFMVNKYEASSITPDKKYIVFSSSYSYPANDPEHGDKYNSTIFFDTKNSSTLGILHFSDSTGISSKDIKRAIKNSLVSNDFPNGPDYLKLEGMSFFPNNKLLFGIREVGNAYDKFNYTITLLEANYQQSDKGIAITSDITKKYDFFPADTIGLNLPLGLSSIEFNFYDSTLYIVTSHETGETTNDICSYLWYISFDDLQNNRPLNILKDNKNKPLKFIHKIEGLSIINKNTLILIADDDRITGENEDNPTFTRKLNETYWCIVKLRD